MTDTAVIGVDGAIVAATASATPAPAVPAPQATSVSAVAAAVNTDTLKSILAALGHDLDAVWEDAIALAKKAL